MLNRSQLNFAHVTKVTLLWRVQNFVVMGGVHFKPEHFKYWSNFEFDRNVVNGTGVRSAVVAMTTADPTGDDKVSIVTTLLFQGTHGIRAIPRSANPHWFKRYQSQCIKMTLNMISSYINVSFSFQWILIYISPILCKFPRYNHIDVFYPRVI